MSITALQRRVLPAVAATAVAGLLVVSAAFGAQVASSPRIVGGSVVATPGWMTQVWIENGLTEGQCGGELVASRWVLTAGHCATNEQTGAPVAPSAFHLRIGVPNLSQPTSADPGSAVDRVVVDPSFRSGQSFGDVALLHLAVAPSAVPLALAGAGAAATGTTPDVLGWGRTEGGSPSPSLRSVAQPILDPSGCSDYGPNFVAESMICAGGVGGQDSCNGDSGGPLALGAQTPVALLVGTVDFGSDPCGIGKAAVYQRVTEGSTADWLRSVLVRPAISASDPTPVKGDRETLKASSAWPDAVFHWDLDGNGTYTDATGATVTRTITTPLTVSVQAVSAAEQDSAVTRITLTPAVAKLKSVSVTASIKGATVRARVPGAGSLRVSAVSGSKTITSKMLKAASARTVTGHLLLTAAQRRRHPEIKLRWTSANSPSVSATAMRRLG